MKAFRVIFRGAVAFSCSSINFCVFDVFFFLFSVHSLFHKLLVWDKVILIDLSFFELNILKIPYFHLRLLQIKNI